jgi:hypothetical protein
MPFYRAGADVGELVNPVALRRVFPAMPSHPSSAYRHSSKLS